jgi:hypothetical protein
LPAENNAMISEAVIGDIPTIIGGHMQVVPTQWVVALANALRHRTTVLDTEELLARLQEKGIRNVDIAKVLGLPDSRVPEIRDRRRSLKLDEGAKLARAFGLEPGQSADPIPLPILRLVVRYVAEELGLAQGDDRQLEELTADVQAFSEFVAEPKVRRSLDAAEGFFQAMRIRRRATAPAAPSGTDPRHAH